MKQLHSRRSDASHQFPFSAIEALVHLVLVSAVRLEAEEHGAWPFSSKPWITSAISRLSSTRVHESSSIVGSMRGANHGWISEDRPIDFDQQDPRDADQGYIDTRRDGFVGFGAGTLADMTLMPLLLVQVFYPMTGKLHTLFRYIKDAFSSALHPVADHSNDLGRIVTQEEVRLAPSLV
ncbi:uncharacterized protein LOC142560942 [Dermacentor variabilis]|uniref:uncharacterized protein LOC142560942 n=1 Tax=Dermacentor variabilis TaxID=34621 RepID=UPI003F5B8A2B